MKTMNLKHCVFGHSKIRPNKKHKIQCFFGVEKAHKPQRCIFSHFFCIFDFITVQVIISQSCTADFFHNPAGDCFTTLQVTVKKERQRRKVGEAAPELMQEGAKVQNMLMGLTEYIIVWFGGVYYC